MTRLQPRLAGPARDALRLLDATTLKLSALAGWAQFRTTHAAAKLHVIYDPAARHPTYFAITPAKTNDIVVAQQMPIEAGATYVFDKGYYDFGFWAALDRAGCRFVTRLKVNTPLEEIAVRPCPTPLHPCRPHRAPAQAPGHKPDQPARPAGAGGHGRTRRRAQPDPREQRS